MATIALIWELGSDLGHIGRFVPIAKRLKESGHRPVMILRDISRAHALLSPHGIEYCQAPLWLAPLNGLPALANFTETLFRYGFLDVQGLSSIVVAWRKLLELLGPSLLVMDHAPSALLAARGLGIPRLVTGNSFAVPPDSSPLPPYRWWSDPPPAARLAETEARAVRNCNAALASCGGRPLEQVCELYDVEAKLITGCPALDVYGPREAALYCGPINTIDDGLDARWPSIGDKRVFAYLKPHYEHFEAVVKALSASKASCLVFAPGIAPDLARRLQAANLAFSSSPLRMADMQAACDMAVCHAGGTVDVMLEAGKPLLLLPMQMEQTMTSHRAEHLGCTLAFEKGRNPSALPKLIARLLSEAGFATNAREYAERNHLFAQRFSVDRLASACVRLLETPSGSDLLVR